jgi:hypothetical protein
MAEINLFQNNILVFTCMDSMSWHSSISDPQDAEDLVAPSVGAKWKL